MTSSKLRKTRRVIKIRRFLYKLRGIAFKLIPLAIGILLLVALYSKIDFNEIWRILVNDVNYAWILLSCLMGILSHCSRAYQWNLLLEPLGVKAPYRTLVNAVFINFGGNIILPRMGDFLRPALLSRKTKTSYSTLLGSVMAERVIDVVLIPLMAIPATIIGSGFFVSFFKNNSDSFTPMSELVTSYWFYLGIACIGMALFIFYKLMKHYQIMEKVLDKARHFFTGFTTVTKLERPMIFIIAGVSIWFFFFLQLYFCLLAFPFTENLPFVVAYMAFFMGCTAGIIPIQAGIGPWHFLIISTLMYYGLGNNEAAAFALIVHSIQTLLNGGLGIYGYFAERH